MPLLQNCQEKQFWNYSSNMTTFSYLYLLLLICWCIWCNIYALFLNVEAACSSKTLASIYKTACCHDSEDHSLNPEEGGSMFHRNSGIMYKTTWQYNPEADWTCNPEDDDARFLQNIGTTYRTTLYHSPNVLTLRMGTVCSCRILKPPERLCDTTVQKKNVWILRLCRWGQSVLWNMEPLTRLHSVIIQKTRL
jgi:hypothetical protein